MKSQHILAIEHQVKDIVQYYAHNIVLDVMLEQQGITEIDALNIIDELEDHFDCYVDFNEYELLDMSVYDIATRMAELLGIPTETKEH